MSDFDLDAIRARQAAARAEAIPLDDTSHLARIEIDNCGMCDDDGYRGGSVCDHQQHSTPEARQAAREALRKALIRPPSVHAEPLSAPERPSVRPPTAERS